MSLAGANSGGMLESVTVTAGQLAMTSTARALRWRIMTVQIPRARRFGIMRAHVLRPAP